MRTTTLFLLFVGFAIAASSDGEEPPPPGEDPAKTNAGDEKKAEGKKVDIEFTDAPAEEVLRFLLALLKKGAIVCDPKLDIEHRKINLKLPQLTAAEALQRVAQELDVRIFELDEACYFGKNPPAEIALPVPIVKPLGKEKQSELDRAIQDLAHEDPKRREAASLKIEGLGVAALPAVQAAMKENQDAERQARLTRLTNLLYRRTPESILARRISFCAPETHSNEVLPFLCSLCKIQFECEPGFEFTVERIQVTDMTIRSFIIWLARLSNAELEATEQGYRFVRRKEPKRRPPLP